MSSVLTLWLLLPLPQPSPAPPLTHYMYLHHPTPSKLTAAALLPSTMVLLFFYMDLGFFELNLVLQELTILGELAKIPLPNVLSGRHVRLLV